ncbi:two-component response regulator ORR26-like [Lycium barbarum]|uniref:two-component response regulator ORR26-like n=1 Tax=Lycium barbarum TaxID=112863 RepID=UPI00293F0B97|nr:two-component response regulator ORR26-like [Lycium barbarum]
MSKEENPRTNTEERYNPMAAPFYGMIEEVRVMLVDHNKEFVNEMVDLLKSYSYEVTTVDRASVARSMLSKGKERIDVIIINANSPVSFKLLAQAAALDIISLFVCDEHNALEAMNALDGGAYLYLTKPLHEQIVKYLWQFVLRKKIQREKAREGLEKNEEKNMPINLEEERNNIRETENDVVSNEKDKLRRKTGRKSTIEINEGDNQSSANKAVRRKVCTEWTADLHAKFIEAVHHLGEGKCFPQDILEAMNVPGLERMQVASHLQKCRTNNWRVPKEQKSIHHPTGQESSSGSRQRSSYRKFGTMPHLQTNVPNPQQQQCNQDQTQRSSEFPFAPINTHNIFIGGESSTQQELYHPRLQVQSHHLSIDNPLNNSFYFTQDNSPGGLQQQHGSFSGMLRSQGLQDPIIGGTNYRPGLAFSSGYHHNQNAYNLDLNAAHVTTYSGSTIMSDIDIGNATINELGTLNANFQQYIGEPNMSDPSNIVAASHVSDNQGSDSNERESYNAYLDFNNMNYLFQNFGPASANLPNEHGGVFNQVYSDDQVTPTPSVQFPGIRNLLDESSTR